MFLNCNILEGKGTNKETLKLNVLICYKFCLNNKEFHGLKPELNSSLELLEICYYVCLYVECKASLTLGDFIGR